jgi:DNA repair protein RadD
MFKLRPYQEEAITETMAFIRKTKKSCVLKLPTAAGKSLIIAELAKQIKDLSGKKVLCTAPSKELIEQNAAKYKSFDLPCSIFSASLNKKSLRHDVVFGSPQTIINEVKKASKFDGRFAAIIIDEAHNITPSLKKIIETMQGHNPNLRVIGLSATPYRMFSGYIYKTHCQLGVMGEDKAKNPYFDHCVYDLNEWDMIADNYITRPVFGEHDLSYDTSGLVLKASGKFDQKTVDQAFLGKGRLTYEIVKDVIEKSANRNAVMFFASSVAHASEIMESLPPENSKLITGETDKRTREHIVKSYVNGEFKYLVNVSVLTTGFDAPIVDTIAILRRTESPALLLQIIGRGVRLHDNKKECLVLDYAENVGNVVYESDPFEPIIKVKGTKPSERYPFICPECNHENHFALDKDYEGARYNEAGYVINEITGLPDYDHAVHLGQRCQGVDHLGNQCNHHWDGKECESCGGQNSKSARVCRHCGEELIDPNEKLHLSVSVAANKNPYEWNEAQVIRTLINSPNEKGTIRLDHYVDGRKTALFNEFVNPEHQSPGYKAKSIKILGVVCPFALDVKSLPMMINQNPPIKISYRKQKGNDFYEAKNHIRQSAE